MNYVKSFTHFLLFLSFIVAQQPILFYSSFTTNDFTTDDGWKIMNIQSSNVYSDCGGIRLLGGYNLFGKKVSVMKMLQLPPHYQIKVKFQFSKIDSWDNEYFYLYIDQQQIEKLQFGYEGINECGNGGYNEKQSDIDITVSHDYSSILIYMTTNLNSLPNDESWGIRDFYLYLYLCPPGCLTCEENNQIIQCIPWLLLNSAFQSNTQSQFNYDGWIINNSYQQTSLCENIPLFGGYQVTGKNSIIQTTIDLPIHNLLKIQIRIVFIDSWENEYLYIDADNQRIISQQYQSSSGLGIPNICGNSNYADSMQNFQLYLTHSQNSIVIKIQTNLNEDTTNESFGIRDFQLFSFNEICGNGIKEGNEQCDDGNLEPFDGCFICQYSCIDGCINCLYGECFDIQEIQLIQTLSQNILKINEIVECEDNNLVPFDGCFNKQYSCIHGCINCLYGKCFECEEGFIYEIFSNSCVLNYYRYIYHFQCEKECKTCQSGNCIEYFANPGSSISLKQNNFEKQQPLQNKMNNCNDIIKNQFEESFTENCNKYCLVCLQNKCLKCNNDSQLINNSCFICGDGILNNINEQCDDYNNNNKDGCSSNCQIEKGFYCQFNEYQQFEYCERCLDQNCLYCYKVNTYFTQFCKQCQKGYYIDNNNGQCIKCDQICLECVKNSKNCIQFNYDYYQLKDCNQTQGLYYNFKLRDCESKCGDGIIIKEEQCDDSNINDYDGCNSKCQIEQGYLLDKTNNLIIKEPLKENIKINQSISGIISLIFDSNLEIIECEKTTLSIEQFDSKNFKFNLTSHNQSCELQIQYLSNIEPKNLIHIYIQYQSNYLKQRSLTEYDQEIIVIPSRQTKPNNEQLEQGKNMAKTYQSVQSSVKYCIAFSFFFGGFNYIWAILDILSWINNFYFLNVNYPQNVNQLFKQAEWGNVISFPSLEVLNQPSDSYYFLAPQKFQDKGVDPLFFNNIQFVIVILILNAITYVIAFSIKTLIQKKFIKQTYNKNKVSIFKMQTGIQAHTLGDVKQQPVKITSELQIPYIVKKIYYPCYQFEQNFLAILLKTIFISYFDISTAIILQLTNQQQSSHYVVAINIIISYLAIIPLAITIYMSYYIVNLNKIQLQDIQFQRKYNSFYQDLNIESNYALQYSFINLIRKTIFITSTISLYYTPIYQTSICFCACLINLMLLFQTNPFINKQTYIQNFIPDLSVTVVVLISIIFSFQDRFGKFQDEFIYILGWIIVVLVLTSIGLQLMFLLKKIIISIIEQIKAITTYLQEKCK